MSTHKHFAGSYPHKSGRTRVRCIRCHVDLGAVTTSGVNEGSPCAPGEVVLPPRPAFWNDEAEAVWMTAEIAWREATGEHVSPEMREIAEKANG